MNEDFEAPPILVGEVQGITVILKPIADIAHKHGYSDSYIKQQCNTGKLIAYKYGRQWFVEENLSEIKSLTTLQDN